MQLEDGGRRRPSGTSHSALKVSGPGSPAPATRPRAPLPCPSAGAVGRSGRPGPAVGKPCVWVGLFLVVEFVFGNSSNLLSCARPKSPGGGVGESLVPSGCPGLCQELSGKEQNREPPPPRRPSSWRGRLGATLGAGEEWGQQGFCRFYARKKMGWSVLQGAWKPEGGGVLGWGVGGNMQAPLWMPPPRAPHSLLPRPVQLLVMGFMGVTFTEPELEASKEPSRRLTVVCVSTRCPCPRPSLPQRELPASAPGPAPGWESSVAAILQPFPS